LRLGCRVTPELPLDLALGDKVYPLDMARQGLLIGEVAKQSGASRKALRLYEQAGILPPARRTEAGYRVYGSDALDVLTFVRQAQRLGFNLEEIRDIVSIKRAGRVPCAHVKELVRRKADDLDQRLQDLTEVRDGLRAMLNGWRSTGLGVICPNVEAMSRTKKSTEPPRRRNRR
jgi:MerR family transcriptional regulator, copper efflux regulator